MAFHKLKEKLEHYERHISSVALVAGFIFDNYTLVRADFFWDHIIFLAYLIIAGLGTAVVNFSEAGVFTRPVWQKLHPWFLFFIQFSFGGLFSSFVVLYGRSASLSASWPFLLLLLGLLIGNEFLKKHYARLTLNVSVFFVALFSFSIFYVPVLLGRMGTDIFILSGIVSLIVVYIFLYLLSFGIPKRVRESGRMLGVSIGTLFILINILYFTNIIPPIPLSLKDAGVFHSVTRNLKGGYDVTFEQGSPRSFFEKQIIHLGPNEPLSVFSSVYAPTRLNTQIVHDWQHFDPIKNAWVSQSRIKFPIVGGRDGGYRGYSQKTNVQDGFWRVDIETPEGLIISRLEFNVERATGFVTLEKIEK